MYSKFTPTDSVTSQLKKLSLILDNKSIKGILLSGPKDSGKSSFLNIVESAFKKSRKIRRIYLDQDLDIKMLQGMFVCGQKPGEFLFQIGPLAKSAINGDFLFLEHIEKASFDVISALIPFLKNSDFSLNGETYPISGDFRIFATIEHHSNSSMPTKRKLINDLFIPIDFEPIPPEDIKKISLQNYPKLHKLEVFDQLFGIFQLLQSLQNREIKCDFFCENDDLDFLSFRKAKKVNLEEFFKCAKRVEILLKRFHGLRIVTQTKELILKEARDCFLGGFPFALGKKIFLKFCSDWNLSSERSAILFEETEWDERLQNPQSGKFVFTDHMKRLLSKIKKCVEFNEPVLLSGETGIGKTASLQILAQMKKKKMHVFNLHQQTETSDLIGGYRPADCTAQLRHHIENFKTGDFLSDFPEHIKSSVIRELENAFSPKLDSKKHTAAMAKIEKILRKCPKRPKPNEWRSFLQKTQKCLDLSQNKNKIAFVFHEGVLLKSIRRGDWILLDEVNLAPPAVLEKIEAVLKELKNPPETQRFPLLEKGDDSKIAIHKDFKIFGSFNPPTDVGKKSLPDAFRAHFTEILVEDVLDRKDVNALIRSRVESELLCEKLTDFYFQAKKLSVADLVSFQGKSPHYSVRSLMRALNYSAKNSAKYPLDRALFDGFAASFLSSLSEESRRKLESALKDAIFRSRNYGESAIEKALKKRSELSCFDEENDSIVVEDFWLSKGPNWTANGGDTNKFIVTQSVRSHLRKLARLLSNANSPILLVGPTSSGKTSLVKYLAGLTGNQCVRFNNHEHTDIQEYLGGYAPDRSGALVFREGPLVKAVRRGLWVILDELNLAPSDVLESLNRLLDDNRELFLPETGEAVQAHERFILFATQNPAGVYRGRKELSKAFKNRFSEIFVDEIPPSELSEIIHLSCGVPSSYADAMLRVMSELQTKRQQSDVFSGRRAAITPRNLLRWAKRGAQNYKELAENGYAVLAEKFASQAEKEEIRAVIQSHCKNTQIGENSDRPLDEDLHAILQNKALLASLGLKAVTWTKNMRRLFSLVSRCLDNSEPVLLIGAPGTSKTTICQLVSLYRKQKLHVINCNQNTEASDFIGEFRPVRSKKEAARRLRQSVRRLCEHPLLLEEARRLPLLFEALEAANFPREADRITEWLSSLQKTCPESTKAPEIASLLKQTQNCADALKNAFRWEDGALIQAMARGELILFDEISLAENAVIERINSVLEPKRSIFVSEKSGDDSSSEIVAAKGFGLIATMNPPGDFGKKSLSKALKSRFTEIFAPSLLEDVDSMQRIIKDRLSPSGGLSLAAAEATARILTTFIFYFNQNNATRRTCLSLRGILSWCDFISSAVLEENSISFYVKEGFKLVIGPKIDRFPPKEVALLEGKLESLLAAGEVERILGGFEENEKIEFIGDFDKEELDQKDGTIGLSPFFIKKGPNSPLSFKEADYFINCETVYKNMLNLVRALQIRKAILVEGSPGVGKTAAITALAKLTGRRLVRVNLSEHTEMMDLLGSDLPSNKETLFEWSDGVLLDALKTGKWVLLDELNLASQTVLEGLNSILDQRERIYIPEIGQTVQCEAGFRVFACQNPVSQGGGRKGLPLSFLSRFSAVYLGELSREDCFEIAKTKFPLRPQLISKIVEFNWKMHSEILDQRNFGRRGMPWEFNLRDVFRLCHLISSAPDCFRRLFVQKEDFELHGGKRSFKESGLEVQRIKFFAEMVYISRLRAALDQRKASDCFDAIFSPNTESHHRKSNAIFGEDFLILGENCISSEKSRKGKTFSKFESFATFSRKPLEFLLKSVELGWPVLVTGDSASGKSFLVDFAAEILGKKLTKIHLSPSTDSSELIGSFEQFDYKRYLSKCLAEAEPLLGVVSDQVVLNKWRKVKVEKQRLAELSRQELADYTKNLAEIFRLVASEFGREKTDSFELKLRTARRAVENLSRLIEKAEDDVFCVFDWVDSPLLNAIERGDWVLIENINFCSPSVLDRLNSLLEPNGELLVNESGSAAGETRKVCPAEGFRIFFSMDPFYGEISRAMRNRCIEIWLQSSFEKDIGELSNPTDLITICRKHLPDFTNSAIFAKTHQNLLHSTQNDRNRSGEINLKALVDWCCLFRAQLNTKSSMENLIDCFKTAYRSKLPQKKLLNAVEEIKTNVLSEEFSLATKTQRIADFSKEINSFDVVLSGLLSSEKTLKLETDQIALEKRSLGSILSLSLENCGYSDFRRLENRIDSIKTILHSHLGVGSEEESRVQAELVFRLVRSDFSSDYDRFLTQNEFTLQLENVSKLPLCFDLGYHLSNEDHFGNSETKSLTENFLAGFRKSQALFILKMYTFVRFYGVFSKNSLEAVLFDILRDFDLTIPSNAGTPFMQLKCLCSAVETLFPPEKDLKLPQNEELFALEIIKKNSKNNRFESIFTQISLHRKYKKLFVVESNPKSAFPPLWKTVGKPLTPYDKESSEIFSLFNDITLPKSFNGMFDSNFFVSKDSKLRFYALLQKLEISNRPQRSASKSLQKELNELLLEFKSAQRKFAEDTFGKIVLADRPTPEIPDELNYDFYDEMEEERNEKIVADIKSSLKEYSILSNLYLMNSGLQLENEFAQLYAEIESHSKGSLNSEQMASLGNLKQKLRTFIAFSLEFCDLNPFLVGYSLKILDFIQSDSKKSKKTKKTQFSDLNLLKNDISQFLCAFQTLRFNLKGKTVFSQVSKLYDGNLNSVINFGLKELISRQIALMTLIDTDSKKDRFDSGQIERERNGDLKDLFDFSKNSLCLLEKGQKAPSKCSNSSFRLLALLPTHSANPFTKYRFLEKFFSSLLRDHIEEIERRKAFQEKMPFLVSSELICGLTKANAKTYKIKMEKASRKIPFERPERDFLDLFKITSEIKAHFLPTLPPFATQFTAESDQNRQEAKYKAFLNSLESLAAKLVAYKDFFEFRNPILLELLNLFDLLERPYSAHPPDFLKKRVDFVVKQLAENDLANLVEFLSHFDKIEKSAQKKLFLEFVLLSFFQVKKSGDNALFKVFVEAFVKRVWEQNRQEEIRSKISQTFIFKTEKQLEKEQLAKLFPDFSETETIPNSSQGFKIPQKFFADFAAEIISHCLLTKKSFYSAGKGAPEDKANAIFNSIKTSNSASEHFGLFIRRYTSSNEENTQNGDNLYSERFASKADIMRLSEVLKLFAEKLNFLLQTFPNNSILLALERSCFCVLRLSLDSTPIMKFVVSIENLLTKSQKWESVCAKAYSIGKEILDLVAFVSQWRKREVAYWKTLLPLKEEEMRQNASQSFYFLFTLLVLEDHGENVMNEIEEFLLQSKAGEFGQKLRALEAVCAFLDKKSLLEDFCGYYSFVGETVEKYIAETKTAMEKEAADAIKIGFWDSKSHWRLKESVEKFIPRINRIVKKYGDALNTTLDSLIKEENDSLSTEGTIKAMIEKIRDKEVLPIKATSLPSQLASFQNAQKTSKLFSQRASLDIIQRVKRVAQNLTKNSVSENRRTLLLLLDKLTRQTARVKLSSERQTAKRWTLFKKAKIRPIFAVFRRFSCFRKPLEFVVCKSDELFCRNIRNLARLEVFWGSFAGNKLSAKEIVDMKKVAGKVQQTLLAQREESAEMLAVLQQLGCFVDSLESFDSEGEFCLEDNNWVESLANLNSQISSLKKTCESYSANFAKAAKLAEKQLSANFSTKTRFLYQNLKISLAGILSELDQLETSLNQTERFSDSFLLKIGKVDSFWLFLERDSLFHIEREMEISAQFIQKLAVNPLVRNERVLGDSLRETERRMLRFKEKIRRAELCRESGQIIKEKQKRIEAKIGHLEHFLKNAIKLSGREKGLFPAEKFDFGRVEEMWRELRKAKEIVFEPSAKKSIVLGLERVLALLHLLALIRLSQHVALNKTQNCVTLFFTQILLFGLGSQDSDEDISAENNSQRPEEIAEGTGMGEGSGSKDVTNELENEEQILGLKNEPENPDENASDSPTEFDQIEGAEVDADFEGDMFDLEEEDIPSEDETDRMDQMDQMDEENSLDKAKIDENLKRKRDDLGDENERPFDESDGEKLSESDEKLDETEGKRGENSPENGEKRDGQSDGFSANDCSDEIEEISPEKSDEIEEMEAKNSAEESAELSEEVQLGEKEAESTEESEIGQKKENSLGESDEGIHQDGDSSEDNEGEHAKDEENGGFGGFAENECQNLAESEKEATRDNTDEEMKSWFNEETSAAQRSSFKRFKAGDHCGKRDSSDKNEMADLKKAFMPSGNFGEKEKNSEEKLKNLEYDENVVRDVMADNEESKEQKEEKGDSAEALITTQSDKNQVENEELNEEEKLGENSQTHQTPKTPQNALFSLEKEAEKRKNDSEMSTFNTETAKKTKTADLKGDESGATAREKANFADFEGVRRWEELSASTSEVSNLLNESLGRIFEPNVPSKLQGDYRTGKRINMKKVIPYIASSYRKNKIWMRRTKMAKRQYQVLLAIDNSESMRDRNCAEFAVKALVTVANALNRLEVGEMAVAKMGARTEILSRFGEPLGAEKGAECLGRFDFRDASTKWTDFLAKANGFLNQSKFTRGATAEDSESFQLVLIITDGSIQEDRERIAKLARKALQDGQLLVAVLFDSSIAEQTLIEFVDGDVVQTPFLQNYPIPHYIVLRKVEHLPDVLADALRQWFEAVRRSD